jgi:hypothetical protein
MPPRKIIKKNTTPSVRISTGSGITAGLEIWRINDKVALVDISPDGRFAVDVATWNTAAGLNADHTSLLKNAACKDTT